MAKELTIKSDHHCGVFLIEAWEKYKLSLFLETAENKATPQKAVHGFCKGIFAYLCY